MGHVNHACIKRMMETDAAIGLTTNKGILTAFCEGCAKGMTHKLPFPTAGRNIATQVGELVHSDVGGPMRTKTRKGSLYYVTFKDDYSGYAVVEFLSAKSEVFSCLKRYNALVKNRTGRNIRVLRSDNGGEYEGREIQDWLSENGTVHQTSAPGTPEQNGVAERFNRTLQESARCMLISSKLGPEMWAEATACATYLLNRVLSSTSIEQIKPYEVWTGRKPDVSNLRVFGCDAYMRVKGD